MSLCSGTLIALALAFGSAEPGPGREVAVVAAAPADVEQAAAAASAGGEDTTVPAEVHHAETSTTVRRRTPSTTTSSAAPVRRPAAAASAAAPAAGPQRPQAAPPATRWQAPATTTTTAPKQKQKPPTTSAPRPSEDGEASFYDYKPGTCAHKTLPFGTVVTVTNTDNGKTTSCTVADRGPFVQGRIIDLERGVFAQVSETSKGVFPAHITW